MGLGLSDLNPFKEGSATNNLVSDVTGSPIGALALGAALGPAGYGLSAAMAGATVGGIAALSSGSLQKGLMAGLGAYGGAGIGGSLMNMGESTIGQGALNQSAAESARLGLNQSVYDEAAKDAVANASTLDKLKAGAGYAMNNPQAALANLGEGSTLQGAGMLGAAAAPMLAGQMVKTTTPAPTQSPGLIRPYEFSRQAVTPQNMIGASYDANPNPDTSERRWFNDAYTALTPYTAPGPEYKKMAGGGPVEEMSNANAVGANNAFPGAAINRATYGTPWQTPVSQNVVQGTADTGVNQVTGEENRFGMGGLLDIVKSAKAAIDADSYGGMPRYSYSPSTGFSPQNGLIEYPSFAFDKGNFRALPAPVSTGAAPSAPAVDAYASVPHFKFDPNSQSFTRMAEGGMASGGVSSLGGYSDGGRMLKGPGDGMSDNIPAVIGGKQPARLADGEFVVPADVVSHLGNGSTDAGAKQLYKMMDRIRQQRTGKKKQAPEVNPAKAMPA